MIKLVCHGCGEDWKEVGASYKRTMTNKIDYYCANCKSKRKPVRVSRDKFRMIDEPVEGFVTGRYVAPTTQGLDSLRTPEYDPCTPKNILCVGDLHLPFTLRGYLEFCQSISYKYSCDKVIFMGDIIDSHYSSFHATDPDGLSAGDELEFCIKEIDRWKKVFSEADVVTGNHDLIILRKAYANGLSKRWIKDFNQVLGVDWVFKPSFIYNNTLFRHGIGQKSAPKAGSEFMNVVQGHHHTSAYIEYRVGMGSKVFGMQVPCGVDRETYAMAYAQEFPKPAIGCSVILDYGKTPIVEMMDL